MRTVLGLSTTSTSIGWVLVDARDAGGDTLDYDAFDVDIDDKDTDDSITDPAATACRARAIATATGYTVDCVRVTSSDHVVDTDGSLLRKALAESGFDEVVSVPLTEATQAWAEGVGRANGHEKTAVCILDRESISLSVIDTRSGAVKTETTKSRDSTSLIDWLSTAFGRNGSQPESLYLIGSRSDLDAIAGPLDEHLALPVVASLDAQLVLARGAALSGVKHVDDAAAQGQPRHASRVRVITVAAAVAVAAMFVLSSAGGPNRLAASESQPAETSSTTATSAAQIPTSADPVAPLVIPPPPAAAAQPVPTEVPEAIPAIPAPGPAEIVAVPSETISPPVPETVAVAPPVQHLPEVQPVQHIPEAQPVGVPALAPVAPAPGPVAPPAAAPIPTPSETIPPPPPPPPDPIAQILFGGLP